MKIYFFFIFMILFINISYAQEKIENFNDIQELELNFKLKSIIKLDKTENNPKLEYIKASMSFYPREDYRQKIINQNFISNPQIAVEKEDSTLTYKWSNIDEDTINKVDYGIDSRILTKNEFVKITEEIKFPIQNLDNSLIKYTQATEFIDTTPEIKSKAYELIGTETDLYKVVFRIADWTKNNIKSVSYTHLTLPTTPYV